MSSRRTVRIEIPPRVAPRAFHSQRASLCQLLLGLALLLTACEGLGGLSISPAVPADASDAPSGSSTDTLSAESNLAPMQLAGDVLIWHSLKNADLAFLTEAMEAVGRDFPDVALSHRYVAPHETVPHLLRAILSGEGPDLLITPASRLPELRAENLVSPLNQFVSETELEGLIASSIFGLIHDQQLQGLPLWAEAVMLFANTDLIAVGDIPSDTTELISKAEEAPSPLLGLYASLFHLSWGLPAFGGVLFDADYQVVLDQSPGGADFLRWLHEAHRTPGITVTTDYEMLRSSFLQGTLPLFVDGPWLLAAAEEALGRDLDIRPLPDGPFGTSEPWLTVEAITLVAGKSADRQRTGIGVGLALMRKTEAMLGKSDRLPAMQDRMNEGSRAQRRFRELLPRTRHMPHVRELDSAWRLSHDLLEAILTGEIDSRAIETQLARFALLTNEENRD